MTTLNLDEIEQRAQAAAALAATLRARNTLMGSANLDKLVDHVPALAADVAALVGEVKRLTAELEHARRWQAQVK